MLDEERLATLLDRYFDQVITPAELDELDEAIQSSPLARELFWRNARWNASLRAWGERSWGQADAETGPLAHRPDRSPMLRRGGWRAASIAVAALGLLGGLAAIRGWIQPPVPTASLADVAVVTATSGARWQGRTLGLGESFGPQRMILEQGEVTLGLSSGTDVVVRGPADFSVRSGLRLQLASGGLAARVPPAAEGFIVDTPAVDVLDLGTAFGVHAGDDGTVDVEVFSGSVEARTGESQDTRTEVLTATMARRFMPGGTVGNVPAGGGTFPSLPARAAGRPVTDGAIRLLADVPAGFADLESNEFMLVFQEAAKFPIPGTLPIDIGEPGIYASRAAVRSRPLGRGEVVDSYLLHFKARGDVTGNDAERIILDGSVTFPRPIVGIVCLDKTLRASDRLLPCKAARNSQAFWGVEFDIDDHLVLSTDRRTLWVSLRVDAFVDHIRVFVERAGDINSP